MPVVIQLLDRFDPIRALLLVQVPRQLVFWPKVIVSKDVYGHGALPDAQITLHNYGKILHPF